MRRRAFLTAAAGAIAAVSLPALANAIESDIELRTPTGTLHGTLTLPADTALMPAGGPLRAALIIAGSGPTDRNGNGVGLYPFTYKLLANALAARGMASVRYDKRGVAESLKAIRSEEDARFDTFVEDAAAWLRQLRADRRLSNIVVAGHSEGSLVGMMAVQRTPAHAFVSLEGAGRPAGNILRAQLKQQLPADLFAQADRIITELDAGRTVADVPRELQSLFGPSVQPYLISWFRYDPAAEIARITIPATIVQGTADVQVPLADAEALAHADPKARLVLIQGMNHVLKHAPDTTSKQAILKGYQDPTLPVEPRVVDAIVAGAP